MPSLVAAQQGSRDAVSHCAAVVRRMVVVGFLMCPPPLQSHLIVCFLLTSDCLQSLFVWVSKFFEIFVVLVIFKSSMEQVLSGEMTMCWSPPFPCGGEDSTSTFSLVTFRLDKMSRHVMSRALITSTFVGLTCLLDGFESLWSYPTCSGMASSLPSWDPFLPTARPSTSWFHLLGLWYLWSCHSVQ